MAATTKIKKDHIGLYTVCGGYISRPFYGTQFKEGDEVKTHHFGGSTMTGVTIPDKPETHNFKKDGQYEVWSTTGISSTHYRKNQLPSNYTDRYSDFSTYLDEVTDWYSNNAKGPIGGIYKDKNKKFQP